MTGSEHMSAVDTTGLRKDRLENLMLIVAVGMLEGPVALDRLENQLAERLLTYRRYRQKVDFEPGGLYRRDDPHFDLANHIKCVRLPGPGGKEARQRFVGGIASEPLDP